MADKLTTLFDDYKRAWARLEEVLYGNDKKKQNNNKEEPAPPEKKLKVIIPPKHKKGGGKIMYGYKKGGKV